MARQVPEGLTGLNAAKSLWAAMLAKIQALKTSDLTNDGDGSSPFATQSYVGINGGKIDKIKVNNVEQTITDKVVNIAVPTFSENFTITLASAAWSNNAQTISNSKFVASGYGYVVSPDGASYPDYISSVIYADDISTNGRITFHCDEVPTSNLTVNILKVEVA